ncbi:heavy metal-responsive transcriptional regulator [Sphaerospermopsis aphanizomenoides BCCUSP55]|uniref:heavy metal-responsive transcriptional regulator n=1 Tax=Sphaerospermopsis aphanizomenoides TaxID=459663 RepID=UPI000AC88340|nr:heavy metal-responsive transcriptional regulator [Sphaerospermopsis aphanizomenoides]MBK1986903.1 heavy metal-responsive transcriptional regulator [Sphaerospermopsis aphanizomenoides BCCUSP55]
MLAQDNSKLIGAVAKESGVPIKTIRYYEELGLLKSSGRTEGGYRIFEPDVFTRLKFIKRAQHLGLTLSEIKEFLNVHDQGELPCHHIKIKLQDKLTAIDEQIHQLLMLKQDLEGLLEGWETVHETKSETICPIIEKE